MGESRLTIQSVTIEGMHKVTKKTYNFADGFNYLSGSNGSGKSTVIQAICLGLLGYVPGYSKTNEAAMKHSSGNNMFIEVVLSGEEEITIKRSWSRDAKGSVHTSVSIEPESAVGLIKLDEIELPIFNFSDFMSQSANAMKQWFVDFLPSESDEIDWESIYNEAVEDGPESLHDEFINYASELSGSGVERAKAVNAWLKEYKSVTDGQIKQSSAAINSLVKYEDVEDEPIEELKEYADMLHKQIANYTEWSRANSLIKNLIDSQVSYNEYQNAIDELPGASDSLGNARKMEEDANEKLTQLREECAGKKAEIRMLSEIKSAKCPYTKKDCEDIASIIESNKKKIDKLNKEVDKITETGKEAANYYNKCRADVASIKAAIDSMQRTVEVFENTQKQIEHLREELPERMTDKTDVELKAELDATYEKITKIQANRQYSEVSENLFKQKLQLELQLSAIKKLQTATDANNLQSRLLEEPFAKLEKNVSKYISENFGNEVEAKFNLSSKNNSFSFGILRNDQYIEYSYLSSGEKCMYVVALMSCLLANAESPLKLILADDIMDHLDSANYDKLFTKLVKNSSAQIIAAGVSEVEHESVISVEG